MTSSNFALDQFIEDVKQARAEADSQVAVESVLRRAVSQPADVLRELGEPTEAGLHRLYCDDDITILNVVWAPLMLLQPHNHNMWASIGIYTGRENNVIWERDGQLVKPAGAAALSEKEIFTLSDNAIHSVANPIERFTGAIHIYGGDFFAPGRSEWDSETLRERPFDIEAAREHFSKSTTRFYSVS